MTQPDLFRFKENLIILHQPTSIMIFFFKFYISIYTGYVNLKLLILKINIKKQSIMNQ